MKKWNKKINKNYTFIDAEMIPYFCIRHLLYFSRHPNKIFFDQKACVRLNAIFFFLFHRNIAIPHYTHRLRKYFTSLCMKVNKSADKANNGNKNVKKNKKYDFIVFTFSYVIHRYNFIFQDILWWNFEFLFKNSWFSWKRFTLLCCFFFFHFLEVETHSCCILTL